MTKSRKTPQEKKAISYTRDRRDTYGENNKSSRKNVPRHKAVVNRINRRTISQKLLVTQDKFDESAQLVTENEIKNFKPKRFKKSPGDPLGKVVANKLKRRAWQNSKTSTK